MVLFGGFIGLTPCLSAHKSRGPMITQSYPGRSKIDRIFRNMCAWGLFGLQLVLTARQEDGSEPTPGRRRIQEEPPGDVDADREAQALEAAGLGTYSASAGKFTASAENLCRGGAALHLTEDSTEPLRGINASVLGFPNYAEKRAANLGP